MAEKAVQTLDRALDILELLATQKNGMGVTEIGNRVGLHKSTVHRLLNALGERGYVEKNTDVGTYQLGMKVVEISSIHLNSIELKTEAAPYLRKLAAETTQPVHLATFVDGEVIYIEKVETLNTIRMYSSIGKRVPMHCSAVGKAIMTGMADTEIEQLLKTRDLKQYTAETLSSIGQVIEQVREARKIGWAIDNQEHEEGIRCIAAPIYDYRGEVIAAVSTSGPKSVIAPEKDNMISEYVVKAAKEISKRMGYTGN
ncbi:IclR family transcriptional regulator [Petroclostridium sp. X23]|uniref:IclR family transcriptional regulator n=1 Tax=Petroclostridium sp. X23 TaxID=3045146 RepID=UPI0024ACA9E8|nr:IclR family transcriptional regulator [Petroclostridium sp. X23]WHH56897.1 IclR family transcriptional regulator [Petroclostridium sp. X23]